jgi:hypothetical protein
MRKILIGLFLLVGVLHIPNPASATEVRVTISDGTTLLTADGGCLTSGTTCSSFSITADQVLTRGFALKGASPAGTTTTLNLLGTCVPCPARHFPSGSASPLSGDTFKLEDSSSTNKLRVIKTDASTDKLEAKGLKITSTALGAGKTLKITFETLAGAFTPVPVGTYAAGAVVKGSYRQGTAIAGACSSESAPCVRQLMQVQNVSLNGQTPGAILATYTASVPCSTNSLTATAYCGPGGSYNPQLAFGDQFFATDTGSINISSINCTLNASLNCPVVHKGTLEVKATAGTQVFTATNSVGQYVASVSVDDPSGLSGVLAAIGAEGGTDIWAGYDSCLAGYRAVPRPPLTNETRNIQNNSSLPVKFGVNRATLAPANEFRLVSILTGDESLPQADRACNDSGYVIFVPGSALKFADVTKVIFDYDVMTLSNFSGDARLGDLIFDDCTGAPGVPPNGAEIRLEIALKKDGVGVGSLVVYLGSDATANFRGLCKDAGLSGKNLVSDPSAAQARVDPSFLCGNLKMDCCLTWAQA